MIPFRHGLIKFLIAALAGLVAVSAVFAAPVPQSKKAASTPSPTPTPAPKLPVEPTVITAPSIAKPRSEYVLPIGQTYVYAGEWRIFSAGIATLRVEQAGQEIRVVGSADAAGTISLLYHVHDRLESFFDSSTFCSRSISRNTEEGFRRVNTNVTFDYQRGKSVLDQKNLKKQESKHEEHDIPGCVTDLLSGLYYVASLPLLQGKTYNFPLNDGGQTLTVDVHVETREQIKTPAGTFNTVRVQPETASGLLKDKGKIWIWYSDDVAHIPVQMRARMSWGTLTFVLQRIDHK